ncbi:hypothetical protein O4H52_11640 [Sphingomonadaceae bacterium G21617-S1]|nr:hypothetical protein [Sphingomonadaceae bacterium G21617-S1]
MSWQSSGSTVAAAPIYPATDPIHERYPDFTRLIATAEDDDMIARLRQTDRVGRPVGDKGIFKFFSEH